VLSDGLFYPTSQLPRIMAAFHFDKLKLVLSSDFFCDEFKQFSEKYLYKTMLRHKFPVF
jgi:hypothetical protein